MAARCAAAATPLTRWPSSHSVEGRPRAWARSRCCPGLSLRRRADGRAIFRAFLRGVTARCGTDTRRRRARAVESVVEDREVREGRHRRHGAAGGSCDRRRAAARGLRRQRLRAFTTTSIPGIALASAAKTLACDRAPSALAMGEAMFKRSVGIMTTPPAAGRRRNRPLRRAPDRVRRRCTDGIGAGGNTLEDVARSGLW